MTFSWHVNTCTKNHVLFLLLFLLPFAQFRKKRFWWVSNNAFLTSCRALSWTFTRTPLFHILSPALNIICSVTVSIDTFRFHICLCLIIPFQYCLVNTWRSSIHITCWTFLFYILFSVNIIKHIFILIFFFIIFLFI